MNQALQAKPVEAAAELSTTSFTSRLGGAALVLAGVAALTLSSCRTATVGERYGLPPGTPEYNLKYNPIVDRTRASASTVWKYEGDPVVHYIQ